MWEVFLHPFAGLSSSFKAQDRIAKSSSAKPLRQPNEKVIHNNKSKQNE